jgi:DNA-binding transcriptional LysR family regulator
VLEALDRLGTTGRAARELGVSVSKVYRRIAQLEAAVGSPCVHRGAGAGKLTETGRALATIARQTASSVTAVKQGLRLAARDLDGEVSLTTVEGFVPLIAPALASLSERAPKLRVSLDIGFQGPSVRKREVDIALAVVPKPPQGLWGKRVMTIRYAAFGTQRAIDTAPRRWIVLDRPLLSTPQALWEKAHAKPIVMRSSSFSTRLDLARSGTGIAILPRRVAALHGELVELDEHQFDSLDRTAWLLTHTDLREVPRVRAVLDALASALG